MMYVHMLLENPESVGAGLDFGLRGFLVTVYYLFAVNHDFFTRYCPSSGSRVVRAMRAEHYRVTTPVAAIQ